MLFDLGDSRLNQRGENCLERIIKQPSKSFPNIFNDAKDLLGFYRFINNDSFSYGELKNGITSENIRQAHSRSEIISIHDTTEVKIPAKAEQIPEFKNSRGFFAHVSLLVEPPGSRKIYGPAELKLYSRSKKRTHKGSTGEQHRWLEQAKMVEAKFSSTLIIHVMDREGDMQELWSEMVSSNFRFVIRAKTNRHVKGETLGARLFDEIAKQKPIAQRTVKLSKRNSSLYNGQRGANKDRQEREVVLNICAQKFDIHKTIHHARAKKPTVPLNLVYVYESSNTEMSNPVEWYLLTSEPIETAEDVLRVVDIYRSRWLIEEFFKCLKSGCQLEKRLFDSEQSWYKALILLLPAATNLINLRLQEREIIVRQGYNPLTLTQLKILEIKAKEYKRDFETHQDILNIIAQIGGHIRSNGPPGWITLWRGYQDLLSLEKGWLLAQCNM